MNGRTAAEIQKLAHALGVGTERLASLADVPPEDLRGLRSQIGEAMFQADKHHFTKVAALANAVPTAVAAKITEFALPPLLAARTAELLEPQRAVDMVARMSDGYLADVSAAMDPSRSPEVIGAIPADRVAMVARELARRQEWVVIGGFVSQVSDSALAASVAEYDGEQLLRIGYVLDDTGRLDEITGMLSDDQLDAMLRAAHQHELWAELDELLGQLGPQRAERISARFRTAAPADLTAATEAAAGRGALSEAGYAMLSGSGARS